MQPEIFENGFRLQGAGSVKLVLAEGTSKMFATSLGKESESISKAFS